MKKSLSLLALLFLVVVFLAGCAGSNSPKVSDANSAVVTGDAQTITTRFSSRSYVPITVQVGMPVKWTIQIEQNDLNGCNNEIMIPKYGIEQKLTAGDTVVEFTPTEAGTVPYSCWMGMIRSKITVVENLENGG